MKVGDNMNYGENIKKIRKQKGFTQKELGQKLGISQAAIGQFESNKANPKMETIQKIADALNVSINDLIPDSYDRTMQIGNEVSVYDYSFIESLAIHKIFTDKERKKIFDKIEHCRDVLIKMNDLNKMLEYSERTQTELENILFKMLTNKPSFDLSDAIIVLSCFLSLKDRDRTSLLEMLIEYCYPHKDLKYWGIFPNTPPQE